MNFSEILKNIPKTISFEFFPPKDEKGKFLLDETIISLAPLGPQFISVTDKVGGSTRDQTKDICVKITEKSNIPSMAHLTCLGATKEDIQNILNDFNQSGIQAIMALRGDPPKGEKDFKATEGGFRYSGDLIEMIKSDGRFSIGCASYPDGHPEAESVEKDWEVLADKFKRGADFSVTQCFFENDAYLRMVESLRKKGIENKVIPGILPITNWKSVKKFCEMCQAEVPERLRNHLDPHEDDPVASRQAGIEYTICQCQDLLQRCGAPGLHIYSLNRSTAAAEIVTTMRMMGSL